MIKEEFKLYIFRHGQTYYNREGFFTGWKDSKLTSKGIKQARIIAIKLRNKKIGAAFYTKLSRSKDTLKEVLRYHPECKIKIEDNNMIERRYGILEGTSHESFIKKIGKQEYALESYGDALENLNVKNRKKIERFLGEKEYEAIHRGYNVAVSGGESFADVEKRVKIFIKKLKVFIRKNRCNVVISGHGNSIRLFRKIMENANKDQAIKWIIPYDDYFEYSIKA
jgi:bisphosphoglycerate-dependent phosphoglycerate mutase family 1